MSATGNPPVVSAENASSTPFFRLRCLLEGESTVFTVTVSANDEVGDLKKLIVEERKNGPLRDSDAADLTLWKVSTL